MVPKFTSLGIFDWLSKRDLRNYKHAVMDEFINFYASDNHAEMIDRLKKDYNIKKVDSSPLLVKIRGNVEEHTDGDASGMLYDMKNASTNSDNLIMRTLVTFFSGSFTRNQLKLSFTCKDDEDVFSYVIKDNGTTFLFDDEMEHSVSVIPRKCDRLWLCFSTQLIMEI